MDLLPSKANIWPFWSRRKTSWKPRQVGTSNQGLIRDPHIAVLVTSNPSVATSPQWRYSTEKPSMGLTSRPRNKKSNSISCRRKTAQKWASLRDGWCFRKWNRSCLKIIPNANIAQGVSCPTLRKPSTPSKFINSKCLRRRCWRRRKTGCWTIRIPSATRTAPSRIAWSICLRKRRNLPSNYLIYC